MNDVAERASRNGLIDDEELADGAVDIVPELLDDALRITVLVPSEREPKSTGKGVGKHEHASWSLSSTKGEVRSVNARVGCV